MKCTRCRAAAEGPLSVAPNVHEMACGRCGTKWREVRALLKAEPLAKVLAAFRAFMRPQEAA